MANNKADLIDGTIDNPINRDQNNNAVTASTEVWTGTHSNGTRDATCTSWTSTSVNGDVGNTNSTGTSWTEFGHTTCSDSNRIYCFEQ